MDNIEQFSGLINKEQIDTITALTKYSPYSLSMFLSIWNWYTNKRKNDKTSS